MWASWLTEGEQRKKLRSQLSIIVKTSAQTPNYYYYYYYYCYYYYCYYYYCYYYSTKFINNTQNATTQYKIKTKARIRQQH